MVDHGVITLTSALALRGLCAMPAELWMCISVKARKPGLKVPKIDFITCAPKWINRDVEEVAVGQFRARAFTAERALADCLLHRHKLNDETIRTAWDSAFQGGKVDIMRLSTMVRQRGVMHLVTELGYGARINTRG
jgi:hypothetical protein